MLLKEFLFHRRTETYTKLKIIADFRYNTNPGLIMKGPDFTVNLNKGYCENFHNIPFIKKKFKDCYQPEFCVSLGLISNSS